MRILFAVFFSCLLATHEADALLTNGIYVVLSSGKGTTVERVDDAGTVVLGELTSTAFGVPSLWSVSNDNSQFRLDLTGAGPFTVGAENHHFAIYVDRVCALVDGNSAPRSDHTMDLDGIMIRDATAAEKVGKALGLNPFLRHHPGHQLLVAWHAAKTSYAPGDPIVLRMAIQNVGKAPIQFTDGGSQRVLVTISSHSWHTGLMAGDVPCRTQARLRTSAA
jgi:hypothetical protein